jgi:hypothetical protein
MGQVVCLHVGKEDIGLTGLQIVEPGSFVSFSIPDFIVQMAFGLLQLLPLCLWCGGYRVELTCILGLFLA